MSQLRLLRFDVSRVAEPALLRSVSVSIVRGTVFDIYDGRREFLVTVRYRGADRALLAPLGEMVDFDDPPDKEGGYSRISFSGDWIAERRKKYDGMLRKMSPVDVAIEQVLMGPIVRFWRYAQFKE